jgi:hypothetical protein
MCSHEAPSSFRQRAVKRPGSAAQEVGAAGGSPVTSPSTPGKRSVRNRVRSVPAPPPSDAGLVQRTSCLAGSPLAPGKPVRTRPNMASADGTSLNAEYAITQPV